MNDVCLIFRFSIFVERGNQEMLGGNVPALHILAAERAGVPRGSQSYRSRASQAPVRGPAAVLSMGFWGLMR